MKFVQRLMSGSRTIAWLSFVSLLNSVVSIICGLLVAKWILPDELGSFNALSIISSYIILVQAGIPSGLSRELPFYMGKGERDLALRYASTAKFFLWYLSLVVMAVCVVFAFYYGWLGNWTFAAGALVVGFTSFQALYVTKYLKVLYRSDEHFIRMANIDLITTLLSVLTLYLVYKYRFYGLCIRALMNFAADWYYTDKWKPLDSASRFDNGCFRSLLKVGMPIYGVASIYGLWPVVQRTVVLGLFGAQGLGLFALANIVQGILSTLNNAVANVTFPKMCKLHGEGKGIREVLRVPLRPFLLSLGVYALLLLAGWPLFPLVVDYFLPNYQGGVEAAQWMFPVALVSSFSVFSNIYMVVRKNHHRIIGYCVGVAVWFLYVQIAAPSTLADLDQFSKAMLWGFIATFLVDCYFYYRYWRSESRNVIA